MAFKDEVVFDKHKLNTLLQVVFREHTGWVGQNCSEVMSDCLVFAKAWIKPFFYNGSCGWICEAELHFCYICGLIPL